MMVATAFGFTLMLAFLIGLAAIAVTERRWIAASVIIAVGLLIAVSMIDYTVNGRPDEPDWSFGG